MDTSKQDNDGQQSRTDGAEERAWTQARRQMVEQQFVARGLTDERVLRAMDRVPRHRFVPGPYREYSYADRPLPIGHGQTISQPYIVALMTQILEVEPDHKILEIGTGCGYQTAVLAEIADEVWSIEVVEPLSERASQTLQQLGYEGDRVHTIHGDGYKGCPDEAPFDRIIVCAAPPQMPRALVDQLARGGRMIIPVGTDRQHLTLIERDEDGELSSQDLHAVSFVPMVHRH